MQWNHLPLPFSVGPTSNLLRAIRGSRKPNLQVATTRARHFYKFATLKTRRKLGWVSFCKDFWDRFRGRARLRIGEKKGENRRAKPFPPPQTTAGLAWLADIFSYLTLFFAFSPTAEPGPRLWTCQSAIGQFVCPVPSNSASSPCTR